MGTGIGTLCTTELEAWLSVSWFPICRVLEQVRAGRDLLLPRQGSTGLCCRLYHVNFGNADIKESMQLERQLLVQTACIDESCFWMICGVQNTQPLMWYR